MIIDLKKAQQRMRDNPIKAPARVHRPREPKQPRKDNRRKALAEMEKLFK